LSAPGTLIEGKYEILGKICEGGMGAIYKVRHRLLDEIRVIKVMRPQIGDDEEMKKRFVQEAKTVTRLKHSNIGAVLDFALDADGTAYIVMEFIDGVTLADVFKSTDLPEIPLALEVAHQTLLALGYLHRRSIVHRDIAPDNLMLTRDDDGNPRVKVIDLGIAKALDKTVNLTSTGVFLGKVKYCSPEQLGDLPKGETVDGRSDLYSLGVVLYEMVTGQRPFKGETPRELFAAHMFSPPIPFAESDPAERVPEPLRAALLKALQKKREDRFPSADDFDREILRLKAEVGEVDHRDLTSSMILTARATPVTPIDSITPSAQNRLDQQFRAQTAPGSPGSRGSASVPPTRASETDVTIGLIPRGSPTPAPPPLPAAIFLEAGPRGGKPAAKSRAAAFIGAAAAVLFAVGYLALRPGRAQEPALLKQPTVAPATEISPAAESSAATPTALPEPTARPEPTRSPASAPTPALDLRPAAQARIRAARARGAAEEAHAPELARGAFEQAHAKEKQAQTLFDHKNAVAAAVAFDIAAQLFEKAERDARATYTAVPAPTRRPEPRPTNSPVPPVPTRPEPTAQPAPAPRSDQDRISDVLKSYERAQSTLDVDLYSKVYAGLTPDRRQQVAAAWQDLKSQEVRLECQPAKISGGSAEASCFERRVFAPRVGVEQRTEGARVLRLEKRGEAWVITGIR
jgi:serine/threonine protein kinase